MKLDTAIIHLLSVVLIALPIQSVDARELGVGQKAPSFVVRDLTGLSQTWEQHAEDVIVLHFWATWCGYCRGEISKLKEIHERWGSGRVWVLAVSVDENLTRLKEFVQKAKLPYTVVPDVLNDFEIAMRYGLIGVPVTYIIAPNGRVVLRFLGPADLTRAIDHILASTQVTY